jgi:hypothetical protein
LLECAGRAAQRVGVFHLTNGNDDCALLWLAFALKLGARGSDADAVQRSVRQDIATCLARHRATEKGARSQVLPTAEDSPERIELWAQAKTGLEIAKDGAIGPITPDEQQRRRRLWESEAAKP